jgi:purine operon repressor
VEMEEKLIKDYVALVEFAGIDGDGVAIINPSKDL